LWDGNKANADGLGFNITGTPANKCQRWRVENVIIENVNQTSFFVNQTIGGKIYNVKISGGNSHGFYLEQFSDGAGVNLGCSSTSGTAFYAEFGSSNVYSNFCLGGSTWASKAISAGQMTLNRHRNNEFSNIRIDLQILS